MSDSHTSGEPTEGETRGSGAYGLSAQSSRPGGMPPMPQWPEDDSGPPSEQPQNVRYAVWLMYIGAALSFISIFFAFGSTDDLRDQARQQLEDAGTKVTPEQIDAAVNVSIALSVVIGLITVALWALIGYKSSKGKNWARLLATILGVLNVLLTAMSLGGASVAGVGGAGVGSILSMLTAVVALVVIVLLWTTPSRTWFDLHQAQAKRK